MNDDRYLYEQLREVNTAINIVADRKSDMSHRELCARLDGLFQVKRAVLAQISALYRPSRFVASRAVSGVYRQ